MPTTEEQHKNIFHAFTGYYSPDRDDYADAPAMKAVRWELWQTYLSGTLIGSKIREIEERYM